MHLSDYDTTLRYSAMVKQKTRLSAQQSTEEVEELILEIAEPNFVFSTGQSIGVLIPGPHVAGNQYHFRLYSIASASPWPQTGQNSKPQIEICVKRCMGIDEYNGEQYPGIASNYLCDLQIGDTLSITGPYGIPFTLPDNNTANLLMLGMGTGIAPFRAFVQHIYHRHPDWQGKVWLFYGAHSGMELLYMNDKRNDFASYYDQETFQAFQAVSSRPYWGESNALEQALQEHEAAVWQMLCAPDTYVYIAGHEAILKNLNTALSKMAGSESAWQSKQAELMAAQRWMEIIY